jgi:hypothetical protein
MQLVLQAKWLNQLDDMPVVVYKMEKGKVIYVTGNKIAELLLKAVKEQRGTARHYTGRTQAVLCSFPEGLDLPTV